MSDIIEHGRPVSLSEWLTLQTADEKVQIRAGWMIIEYRLRVLLRRRLVELLRSKSVEPVPICPDRSLTPDDV